VKALLLVLACVVLDGCGIPAGAGMQLQAMRYSGDGVIHTCSNIFAGGYRIDFPSFAASEPHTASYRLSNVPQVYRVDGRSDPTIYLRFYSDIPYSKVKERLSGKFQLTLLDGRGQVATSIVAPLSTAGLTATQRLYGVSKGTFHFDPNASYVLRVSYTPGAVPPPAKQFYFAIDNCAFY
jgi:hypothetical protein